MVQLEYICGTPSYRGQRRFVLDANNRVTVQLIEQTGQQEWHAEWAKPEVDALHAEIAAAKLETTESQRSTGKPGEVKFTLRVAKGNELLERTFWWGERDDHPALDALVARIQNGLRSVSENHIEW